jgi:hypothetical protein
VPKTSERLPAHKIYLIPHLGRLLTTLSHV